MPRSTPAVEPPHRRFAILGVPSSAGGRRRGQENGPGALRNAGFVAALRARSPATAVTDAGDLPRHVFAPDGDDPRRQNLRTVVRVVREVRDRVGQLLDAGLFPVVFGGDCTITIGVVAAFVARRPHLGLLYFDADLDRNTPETSPSGILDGMVTAHLLGEGAEELAAAGPRCPLLPPSNLLYFGYDVAGGGIDRPEIEALLASGCPHLPSAEVRQHPEAAAREALRHLLASASGALVHFDVDTLDTQAVDVPHVDGLPMEIAMASLQVFLRAAEVAGLVVTELNPSREPDGATASALASRLPQLLAGEARETK